MAFSRENESPCEGMKGKKTSVFGKSGSTQNRTGVLRTKTSYAAPTPWNHIPLKGERDYILVVVHVFMGVSWGIMCVSVGKDVCVSF